MARFKRSSKTRKNQAAMLVIAIIVAVLLLLVIPGVSLGAPAEVKAAAVSADLHDIFGVAAVDATHFWGVGGTTFDASNTAYGVVLFHNPATGAVAEQYRYNPGPGGNGLLYGVDAISANEVYAVGGWNTAGTGGVVLRYDGASWAQDATVPANLTSVTADGGNVWAVGRFGPSDNPAGKIYHREPGVWKEQLSLPGFEIGAIYANGNNLWAAAGDPGGVNASRIYSSDNSGANWNLQETLPVGVNVGNIYGTDSSHVWAACTIGPQRPEGSGAVYFKGADDHWVLQYTRDQWLQGIYATGTDVWASGEFGTIVHSSNSGASWSLLAGGTDDGSMTNLQNFHDLNGYDATHVWVSGGTFLTSIAVANTGSNVSVNMPAPLSGASVGLTFNQVTGAGSTTAILRGDPAVGFRVVGGTCMEVTTTSTYTGKITVRVGYDPATLTVSPTELRLMHQQGGNWVDVTTSVDTVNHWVMGEVDSLSPFVLAAPAFYFAEGTCRPGFDPYITVQNPSGVDASVKITYMKGDGTNDSQTFPVTKQSRVTIPVKAKLGEGNDPAYDFSAKVECLTAGANIIAERPMYFDYNGWTGGSCVIGASGPSPVWYFAEGTCRPGFDPYITVQNPSGVDASVKITYMKGDGTNDSQTFPVTKQSRVTIPVKTKLGEGNDPAYDFSAKVESLTPGADIIAERPMYFNYNGWTGGSCVVGATGQGAVWYFAEGTCRPGFDPYLTVQNPGTNDANVRITYMKGDGTTDTQTFSVAKSSRVTIPVKAKLGEGNDPAFDFSAKVESLNAGQQLIIAERPMYFNYNGWTGGSCVVGSAAGPSPVWYFAEGTCRPGFDPYITIQNPSGGDASVKITYMKGDGTTDTQTFSVTKSSRVTVPVKAKLGEGNDAAHDFSAKVESLTSGADIIAERPMYFNYSGWDGGSCVIGYRP